jgi:hypothetical protein
VGIRRRIEITAFRRTTIIFRDQSGESGAAALRCSPSESKQSEPNGTSSALTRQVDLGGAQLSIVDDMCSSELALLFDALVEDDGNSPRRETAWSKP